jgi:hypothetical protein
MTDVGVDIDTDTVALFRDPQSRLPKDLGRYGTENGTGASPLIYLGGDVLENDVVNGEALKNQRADEPFAAVTDVTFIRPNAGAFF